MAQPQSMTVPPFCFNLFLTNNKHTAENILCRWNYTLNHLREKGITVDNCASDGDSRFLKVMKFKSQLGVHDNSFLNCQWYSCGHLYGTSYTQDAHHIGTKTRNRLTKVSRLTSIGSHIISISLIKQILKARHDKTYLFTPYRQGSQPCEGMFRQIRSMSSTFSTVVNCSIMDIINRIRRIQMQSDIVHVCKGRINFPRMAQKEIKAQTLSTSISLPTEEEIIALIEKAKFDVVRDFECLKIDDDDDDDGYVDGYGDDDNYDCEGNLIDNADDKLNDGLSSDLSGLTGELQMKDYSATGIKLNENSPFAVVMDSAGKEIVVRKSSICWLLSSDKYKLSSDRIQRVMEREYTTSGNIIQQPSSDFIKHCQIGIGDWCIFSIQSGMLAGMILSLCYTSGTTFKSRQYTKSAASITSTVPIGVLGTWYCWNDEGKLTHQCLTQSFVGIENYKGTIPAPMYKKTELLLSKKILTQTKGLL